MPLLFHYMKREINSLKLLDKGVEVVNLVLIKGIMNIEKAKLLAVFIVSLFFMTILLLSAILAWVFLGVITNFTQH